MLWRIGHCRLGKQRVLGKGEHYRAGPPGHRGVESMAHVLGDALDAVDLRHPLRHLPVHAPVIDLLERFALGEFVRHLADEHHHRRRVLEAGMHADGAVGGAGTARHEEHARLAGELAVRLGHVGGAAFLAADDEGELVAQVVQAVEHRQVALAGHAERHLHALGGERVGEDLAAVPGLQIGFHAGTFSNAPRSRSQHSASAAFAVSTTPPNSTKPCTMSAYSR
jgi:hypothetical protein